jgi:hypothetical protein
VDRDRQEARQVRRERPGQVVVDGIHHEARAPLRAQELVDAAEEVNATQLHDEHLERPARHEHRTRVTATPDRLRAPDRAAATQRGEEEQAVPQLVAAVGDPGVDVPERHRARPADESRDERPVADEERERRADPDGHERGRTPRVGEYAQNGPVEVPLAEAPRVLVPAAERVGGEERGQVRDDADAEVDEEREGRRDSQRRGAFRRNRREKPAPAAEGAGQSRVNADEEGRVAHGRGQPLSGTNAPATGS